MRRLAQSLVQGSQSTARLRWAPTITAWLTGWASPRPSLPPPVSSPYWFTVSCAARWFTAGVAGRDLGGVASDVQRAIEAMGQLPPTQQIAIRGASQTMRASFRTLSAGIVLAIVLVYLLMVANFQSWLEPFIITMAVPGALAGVLWMLVATGTTINVESLMGAIMAVGVGVANGNLLITFANELREQGRDPVAAAIEAGRIRLRPIIMTALAMILGMLPMALGLGAGGEQNLR
jgi:multidrug efflux pump subunit AcrB